MTITGPAVVRKGNYRVPIGTPLRFLLETVGAEDDLTRVFLGGPMMGQAVSSLDIPVTKGVTGVIAFTARETGNVTAQNPGEGAFLQPGGTVTITVTKPVC